jgi:hypothetical protein
MYFSDIENSDILFHAHVGDDGAYADTDHRRWRNRRCKTHLEF